MVAGIGGAIEQRRELGGGHRATIAKHEAAANRTHCDLLHFGNRRHIQSGEAITRSGSSTLGIGIQAVVEVKFVACVGPHIQHQLARDLVKDAAGRNRR